jgi:superfamily I DNA and/or RNA helicase
MNQVEEENNEEIGNDSITQVVPKGRPVSVETQNKIVRLFSYLEKALALDDSVTRDFLATTTVPSPWWLADYPNDIENLYIRPFDNEKTPDEESKITAWLRVEKKSIQEPPDLPSKLFEWINEVNPIDSPKSKEKIDRKVYFNDENKRVKEFDSFRKKFEQGDSVPENLIDWVVLSPDKLPESIEFKYVEDNWIDHSELHNLLEGYVENDWKKWAEKVRKIYQANVLYDQLYAMRLLLKNEGDSYELLLGHGLLTWQHSSVGKINAPVFLTPLVIEFNPIKRIIEVVPDTQPTARPFVEISSLYEMDNPADKDLSIWADSINANPFDFWHLETLKAQSNWLINTLSTTGEDSFTDQSVSNPKATALPSIWNAPVIFARKRPNDLWSKYAKKIGENIQGQIEDGACQLTDFVRDLVGDYEEEKIEETNSFEENLEVTSIKESDLFFPLPWNDEQKRIAERIDANYGVVVKGPPGTGKSHTIANLISRFLAQGKSVLVTSQTSKALEVLRDKLPKNIQSLAVSQLEDSGQIGKKTSKEIMAESVSEISSNLGEGDTKFSNENVEKIRKEVARIREEKASLANKIRKYILTDSNEEIEIDGEKIKPIDAAKLVNKYKNDPKFDWLTDQIPFNANISFTEEDLSNMYGILLDVDTKERDLFKFELPTSSVIPDEKTVLAAFASHRELSSKVSVSNKVFTKGIVNFNQEELSFILNKLSEANKTLLSIDKLYEQEIFDICNVSSNELEKWKKVLEKVSLDIDICSKSKNTLIGHDVSGTISLNSGDLLEGLNSLVDKVSNKTKIGTFGKLLLSSNAKKLFESYKIDGQYPDTFEKVEILRASILGQIAEREINLMLKQSFSTLKNKVDIQEFQTDMFKVEVLVGKLSRLVNYANEFTLIPNFFSKTKEFSDLLFVKKEDLEKAIELVESQIARFEVVNLDKIFSEWIDTIDNSVAGEKHPVVIELREALLKKNSTGWKNASNLLNLLRDKTFKASQLEVLAQKVKQFTPNLYKDIVELANNKKKFECPNNLPLTFKISRLESWLNHIHDHANIDSLQGEMERLTKREYELNADLVTTLAWQRQIKKVTKKQRDALMAWSDSIKKYGKGTGRHANKWLHSAQESLKEAKNAVPVWIMPLHRAAQMFSEPKAGMFDIVIFDEASQCDIKGLTIGYLGKKLLVVGDPDQISPAGIFQDMDKCFELISRYLFDVPHKDNFSINSSLFSLAEIRIPNMIQLKEHFRCVPEIIAFSNHFIYHNLEPLRYPNPKGLLKPTLVPIFVDTGYQNTNSDINEPEANKLVEKLVECLEDPNYQKRPDGSLCTFGIISLLATDQAKYIKDLILKHPKIGEKIIEERRIVCGNAYAFQGDERDVMFLSMVKALDPNKPNDTVKALTDKGTSQRFNVAATRARDQVFLFHSIPLTEFKNPEDWRYRLLNWFYDPKTEELKAGREALKREFESGRASQFSVDVGNLIIDRGYQVIPEFPVIGRRIDLVVQGTEARLAVECDGNQYHTLENFEDDWNRQRQLERAGWIFWRLTGSSFYRYKEKALDSLWKKLDELGIKPL